MNPPLYPRLPADARCVSCHPTVVRHRCKRCGELVELGERCGNCGKQEEGV